MDDPSPPIACTLNRTALTDREGAWRALIADGLLSMEVRPDGIRLTLRTSVDERARELVALEAECCAWFTGTVSRPGDEVVVDLIAAGDGPTVLAAMFSGLTAPT